MFDIRFIEEIIDNSESTAISHKAASSSNELADVTPDHQRRLSQVGQITLGRFTERFESPLHYWDRGNYEQQWYSAASRVLSDSKRVALVTAMYDPAIANFLMWWAIYREENYAFFQNQLFFLDKLTIPFDIARIDELVRPRQTVNEDGRQISEWSVPLEELESFLNTKRP